MGDVENSNSSFVVALALGAVLCLIGLVFNVFRQTNAKPEKSEPKQAKNVVKNGKPAVKQQEKKKKPSLKDLSKLKKDHVFNHPWVAKSFSGHTHGILDLDISPNGKYIVSCSPDRTLSFRTLKAKQVKTYHARIEFDHALKVRFSPDSKAVVMLMESNEGIRVLKMGKTTDGSLGNFQTALEFPTGHKAEIINMGISCCGRFIMTCDAATTIKVWNLKGEELTTIVTNQVTNSFAMISPCGRFLASCGFTPDVKVYSVNFTKDGTFKDATRAFSLMGHTAGVYCCDFSADTFRMVSISKDRTWRLWDIDVKYELQQDPKELSKGSYTMPADIDTAMIKLSPDCSTVCVGVFNNLYIYDAYSAALKQSILDVHAGPINRIVFDENSEYIFTTGDKKVQMFHNVVGFQANIIRLNAQLEKARNAAAMNSLKQRIEAAKKALEATGITGLKI